MWDTEDLRLDTLWTTTQRLTQDYTVSAKLLDADGVLVAQFDSQPQLNQRPTTTWQVDELVYSPHAVQLRDDLVALPAGDYQIAVELYVVDGGGLVSIPSMSGATLTPVGQAVVD
jgi:hypothetical protein